MGNLSLSTTAATGAIAGTPFVEAPERLRRFVASMPGLVVLLDADGRVMARSVQWAGVFQDDWDADPADSTPADAPVRFTDRVDDPKGVWAGVLDRCIREQTAQRGSLYPVRVVDDTTYWMDWEVRPWSAPSRAANGAEGDGTRDAGGKAGDAPGGDAPGADRGAVLFFTDRTEQHRAEQLRQQVGRRFDALVDTISEGVLLMDGSGVFRDCNAAAESILGRPADEILGTKFNDARWNGLKEDGTPLPNAEFPFWRAYFEREAVRDEVMGIYPPQEPPRWIRVNAQPLFRPGSDEPYAVLACFDDITDEQLKDEALQTSRDLLSSVLTTSLDGILVFQSVRDTDGAVVDFECLLANPQAEKMLNLAADELVGSRLLDLMPVQKEKGLFDAYVEVVETGEPFETEVRYDAASLDAWFQVVAVKIEDGFAVTYRDVSERKEAAQAMAAANEKLEQRNRALRDFAYIASHDLQEPLRKISAFSNLVLEDYGDKVDEAGHHYLERMQDAAQRMSQLISDLLVYSRVTTRANPFEPVDLTSIVENVKSDLDMQIKDVDGTVDAGALPEIEADPTQMRQLLQNLIGNALKFHRPDVPPVVRVRAELLPTDAVDAPRVETGGTRVCRLTVSDNGIGFEQKYADRIFTPFKRLHGRSAYAGTGMGLAICRRIVERHGGEIRVDSTPDEGTTFIVTLPVDRGPDRIHSPAESTHA